MYGQDFQNEIAGRMEPEEELFQLDRDIRGMQRYRQKLVQKATKKQLDPIVELAVTLAHEAGELKGRYEGQRERNDKQQETLGVQRTEISELREQVADREHWQNRALDAEASIARSKKLKRKR